MHREARHRASPDPGGAAARAQAHRRKHASRRPPGGVQRRAANRTAWIPAVQRTEVLRRRRAGEGAGELRPGCEGDATRRRTSSAHPLSLPRLQAAWRCAHLRMCGAKGRLASPLINMAALASFQQHPGPDVP